MEAAPVTLALAVGAMALIYVLREEPAPRVQQNPMRGEVWLVNDRWYSIGFNFTTDAKAPPLDRVGLGDFFSQRNCTLEPSVVLFAKYLITCSDMPDRQAADEKLKTLLPQLNGYIDTHKLPVS